MTQAIMFRHGGAVSQIADDATAAGHRDAAYMAHPIACWQDPAQTELHLDWVRRFSAAMAPFTTGGVHLNFEPDEGEERMRAGYGAEKYAKLVALKEVDPENLFRSTRTSGPAATRECPRLPDARHGSADSRHAAGSTGRARGTRVGPTARLVS